MEVNIMETCNGEDNSCSSEFEFMPTSNVGALSTGGMKFADELFSDGKLLPLQSNFRHTCQVLDAKSKRVSTEVQQPIEKLTVASPLLPALAMKAPTWTKKLREVFKFTKGQFQKSKDDANPEKERLHFFTFCFGNRPMGNSAETDDVGQVMSKSSSIALDTVPCSDHSYSSRVMSPESCNSAGSYASPIKDTPCSTSYAVLPCMNSVESEHMRTTGSDRVFCSSSSSRRTFPVRRKNVNKHPIFLSKMNVITGMIQFRGRKKASTPSAKNLLRRIAMRKLENGRNSTGDNNDGQLQEKAKALPHTQYTKSASIVHVPHYASARVNPLLNIPVCMGPSLSSVKARKANLRGFFSLENSSD